MAINDRGEISGSVSGGCVEGAVDEIAERARRERNHAGGRRRAGRGGRAVLRPQEVGRDELVWSRELRPSTPRDGLAGSFDEERFSIA
jgi:xanthine/CO dehydrogenase XdhC/CoxF family maturation factor